MRYAQHRSSISKSSQRPQRKKSRKWVWVFGVLIVLTLLIVWFASRGDKAEDTPELLEVEEVEEELDLSTGFFQEIELKDVDGSGSSGTSRRGVSGLLYSHVVVATLPAIDIEAYFYEGWLVEPGVTDFFSTGEMFPREDGKWGLLWEIQTDEAVDNLIDFTKVVVTLELRDDDPAPSLDHVIEGEF